MKSGYIILATILKIQSAKQIKQDMKTESGGMSYFQIK
jgi:hypothetical protein